MFSIMKLYLNQLGCGVKVWRSLRGRDPESLSSLVLSRSVSRDKLRD